MSECKTVTLRTRPLKKGMLSFYLDYYPGYRDQETMKTIRHEGLNIYIYANPKDQRERDFNASMSEKAEAIRCRRFEAIVNERYDFFDKHKYKSDFLEYYRKQLGKHDQKWAFVYQHFYNFVHGKCTVPSKRQTAETGRIYYTELGFRILVHFQRIPENPLPQQDDQDQCQ